jgi:hypothetical protein
LIEYPTRNPTQTQRDVARAPTRGGDLSLTDIAWLVNRQIFKHRFLLTAGGGPIRAGNPFDDDDSA